DALSDDALSDGHLHDTDMNNGLRKCTMHESIRQVTCKMSAVSKTTTALHPALALESSSVCPRYIMEQCVAPIPPVPCASTLLARVKMLECLARDVAPCVSASNVACAISRGHDCVGNVVPFLSLIITGDAKACSTPASLLSESEHVSEGLCACLRLYASSAKRFQ
ncbi:hypothetical protein ADUPG1_004826, partial [Aduncisulcus paluster]